MRSVSVLILAVLLTGCTTTQDRSARLDLRARRTIAGREPVHVVRENPDVRVGRVALVRGRRTAVVVELTNTAKTPVTDVPISVGVGRTPLNRRHGLEYFETHVASIAPGATVRWVFVTKRTVPKGQPFARAGVPSGDTKSSASSLPKVDVTVAGARAARVRNDTDIPQYELPVYALAERDGRDVAAGRASVEELAGGSSRTVPLTLAGRPGAAPLRLETLPTIFR